MNDAKKIGIIIKEYFKTKGQLLDSTVPSHRILYRRNLRAGKDLLECSEGDLERAVAAIHKLARWAKSNNLSYSLETVVKRWLSDNTPTQRPYILEHGKRYELRKKDEQWYVLDGGKWYKYSGRSSEIKYE